MSMLSLKARLDEAHAKRAKGEGGFTLIELLVVVVIIGILVAIAIPLYLNYRKGAAEKSVQSDVRAAVSTVEQCIGENNNTVPDVPADSGKKATTLTFRCGGTDAAPVTEKANVSGNNALTFAAGATTGTYTISGTNTDVTYTYDSSTGKTTKS